MDKLNNYKEALQELYDHVGFVEDWVVYPIDDATEYVWAIDRDIIKYADSIEEFNNEEGNYYEDEIDTPFCYKKHVYEGEDFTMIFCDPNVDGMKWFRIFDNTKKIK